MTGRHSRPRGAPVGTVWSTTLVSMAVSTLLATVVTLNRPVPVAGLAINGSVTGSIVGPDDGRLATAAVPAARPLRLRIAKIGVSTDLMQLGVDQAGARQPPDSPKLAGWFADGPVPGDAGPAIVTGHVDADGGPGVFFQLRALQLGDRIMVERSDGRTVAFSVTAVRVFSREEFPATEVYSPTPVSQLRLVTCGGPTDQVGGRPLDNIFVQAVAVP
jgi:hypothetical protein